MPLCTDPLSHPNPMSSADDAWVAAAMADDAMVVELLAALRGDAQPFHRPDVLSLEWSVRQRRSKPVPLPNPKKPGHRGSPATPLSWSGAISLSGGSGGGRSEESALPAPANKLVSSTGSKADGENQKTTFKRSRKRKNLAELRDEENTLVKERRKLKREIAALCSRVENERATNQNLKRMKLELQPLNQARETSSEETISDQLEQTTTACSPLPPIMTSRKSQGIKSSSTNGYSEENSYEASDFKFIIPDLNIPFDEVVQSSNAVVCGFSSL